LFCCIVPVGLCVARTAGDTGDTVTVTNPAAGEPTEHAWNATVSSTDGGTVSYVIANYTGTGANLTASGAYPGSTVTVNGTTVDVKSFSRVSDTRLNVTLNTSVSVSTDDRVELTLGDVQNPGSSGSYTASLEVNDSSTTVATAPGSFDIVDGGYINGSVVNGTGSGLGGASVTVTNESTGSFVSGVGTDSAGNYSAHVPAGDYLVHYGKDGYSTETATVSVSTGTENTTNATLVRVGYVNGTVVNRSDASLSGADVTLINSSTTSFVDGNTSTATGDYSVEGAPGNYTLRVTAPGYATNETSVNITDGGVTTAQNVTLTEVGYINGTVRNQSGTPLGGINLVADSLSGSNFAGNTSVSDGSFSMKVAPGRYDVVAYDNPDYEFNVTSNVSVSSGTTTNADVTLTTLPERGTITGRVVTEDGTPVAGVNVSAGSSDYEHYNMSETNSTGPFAIRVPAGTYRVWTDAGTYASVRRNGIDVAAHEQTSVELTPKETAYVTGRVTNASGPVPNTPVLATTGEGFFVDPKTNATGHYNVSVPANASYSVTPLATGQNGETKPVDVGAGGTSSSADFSLEPTRITASSVSIESGPGEETKLGVRAAVQGGLLQAQLVNESATPADSGVGAPQELTGLGVRSDTTVEINLTVTNFSADSLLWALNDARFETSPNETIDNATDVTIRGSPVTLQATTNARIGPLLFQDPDEVQWPTDRKSRADLGRNQTVYVGVFDLQKAPGSVRDTLKGMSVTTNAQAFSAPVVRDDSLRIWIAGPSKTVAGGEHTGFYQATIPDAQLDAWNVDDPQSELNALFKGRDRAFTVTETADGARIRLDDISYSAGYVEVNANPQSDGGGDGGGSGGSGGDASDVRTATATATSTVTPTPESNPTSTSALASEPTTAGKSTPTATPAPGSTATEASASTTPTSTPGFGLPVALTALVLTALLLGRPE
jgi:PGF-CTERM protein